MSSAAQVPAGINCKKAKNVHERMQIHTLPRWEKGPSPSPACMKLESYLRLAKVPHDVIPGNKDGPYGRWPFMSHQGYQIGDSSSIILYVKENFKVDLEANLTKKDHQQGTMILRLVENSAYYALCRNRWVDNYSTQTEMMKMEVPGLLKKAITSKIQSTMIEQLNQQGCGDRTTEEYLGDFLADMEALQPWIPTTDSESFLLGSATPTVYDCAVFAFLDNLIHFPAPVPCEAQKLMLQNDDVVAYVRRMRSLVYPDVDELVKRIGKQSVPETWDPPKA